MPKKKTLVIVLILALVFIFVSFMAILYLFSNVSPEMQAKKAYKVSFSNFMDKISYANAVEVAYMLNASNLDLNKHDENGWAPLPKAAALNPDIGVLSTLISRGAKPNFSNRDGLTPLMASLLVDQKISYIKFLVENKADVNSVDFKGVSVLMIAAYSTTSVEKIKYLISKGAKVNYQSQHSGLTALMLASYSSGNTEIINALLDAGANKKLQSNQGFTAYNLALRNIVLNKNQAILNKLKP